MIIENFRMATAALLIFAAPFVGGAASAYAAEDSTKSAAQEKGKMADFLFVQSAESMSYANGKLTLKEISSATVMFSDRPDRIAGHMATAEFVPFWKEGKDSFLSNPPNANLSIFGTGKVIEVVLVLNNPVLKGKDLTYDVKVLQGKLPAKGELSSLFIDVIGMPLTPVSYAGVARRSIYRRY